MSLGTAPLILRFKTVNGLAINFTPFFLLLILYFFRIDRCTFCIEFKRVSGCCNVANDAITQNLIRGIFSGKCYSIFMSCSILLGSKLP